MLFLKIILFLFFVLATAGLYSLAYGIIHAVDLDENYNEIKEKYGAEEGNQRTASETN